MMMVKNATKGHDFGEKMRKLKALLQKFPNRFMWQSRLVENVTICPT